MLINNRAKLVFFLSFVDENFLKLIFAKFLWIFSFNFAPKIHLSWCFCFLFHRAFDWHFDAIGGIFWGDEFLDEKIAAKWWLNGYWTRVERFKKFLVWHFSQFCCLNYFFESSRSKFLTRHGAKKKLNAFRDLIMPITPSLSLLKCCDITIT